MPLVSRPHLSRGVVWAWHETNKANTEQSNLTMAEGTRFLYEPGKFQVTNEMKQQFEKDGYIIVR